jgi:hypothetical protein
VNKPKPDIEETFRQLFNNHELAVSNADWAAISGRMQSKRRGAWLWFIPAVLLLCLGTWLWWIGNHTGLKASAPKETALTPTPETHSSETRRIQTAVASAKPTLTQAAGSTSSMEENRREKLPRNTGQSESATETESHEYSRSGSGTEGSNSQPVSNENSETEREFLSLPARRIHFLPLSFKPVMANVLNWRCDKLIRDLYSRAPKPYVAFGSISGFNQSRLQNSPAGSDWQGKTLAERSNSPGFFGGVQALYAIPVGKFHLQSGVQAGMDLSPRRTNWNYTTRIVSDSFPYRNVPGDTLFWVPVRYRDTQMEVQTEIRMRSIAIPLQWTRTIALNPKSGIVLQGGVRLERWSLISGTTVNPQNDRTWSQQQFNAGVYGLTAPLAKSAISRWQGSGNIGVGAYRRLNDHWVVQGLWSSGTQLGGIKPAQNQVGMRQNFGYLHMQMLFTW